ncbi:MAG TPA: sugar transferase [Acidimicrobiales bacterium]|jgi:exopolysaccharide biosynthesis polyprenyl glycosylphosphotransferase
MKAINSPHVTGSSAASVHDLLTRAATVPSRPGVVRLARVLVLAADTATIVLSMATVGLLRGSLPTEAASAGLATYAMVCAVSLPLWLVVFARYRLYHSRHVSTRRDELTRVVHAVGISVVATALVAYGLGRLVPRSYLVTLFGVAALAMTVEREVVRLAFSRLRRRGHCLRPVVIAGTGSEALALASMLAEQPELGYRVVGLLGHPEHVDERLAQYGPVLDARSKVPEQVRLSGATGVLVATTDVDLETSNRITRVLTDDGIHVELSSSLKDIDATRLSVRPLGRFPVLYVEAVRRDGWRQAAKRAFDIGLALVALVLSAPVLLAAAVAVKATSRGPVFFRQERVGYRGRRFHILKLRSMYVDGERRLLDLTDALSSAGPVPKFDDDPRVTRVGRVLRKLSIDELPQLVNVLKGEMSMVGPRPEQPSEVKLWTPELFDRLRVRPGLTGLWQVSGRSSARHMKDRWDLYYVDNWSMAHDLAILMRTLPVVLSQKGAY